MVDIEEIKNNKEILIIMDKKEFKVGEVFQYGLKKLKCVKSTQRYSCIGCYFKDKESCDKIHIGSCFDERREDKTDVIFVKVEE